MSNRLKFKASAKAPSCKKCLRKGHHTSECVDTAISSSSTSSNLGGSKSTLKRKDAGHYSEETLKKKNKTGSPLPSPYQWVTFEKDVGCVDLASAVNFLDLLDGIRSHFIRSSSTRSVYLNMAQKFHAALPEDIRLITTPPTDRDFLSYVTLNWPTMRSANLKSSNGCIQWSHVTKGPNEAHTIHIFTDIIKAAELSRKDVDDDGNTLPIQLYNLVLTTIIMHELSHAFTKTWFTEIVTPIRVGIGKDPQIGESGWLVEETIMGGVVVVDWNNRSDFGKMELIGSVLLENSSGEFKISESDARSVLESLRTSTFTPPQQTKPLLPAVSTSTRARVTIDVDDQNLIAKPSATIGLGIKFPVDLEITCSYVGDDK